MKVIFGILFTFLISSVALLLSSFPILHNLGSMVTAILLAILYRQLLGYPEFLKDGIQFSSKKILRLAIILFGFKLNVDVIFHQGGGLLLKGCLTILLALTITYFISKLIKADKNLSFLLAVGTGVCGAAAIAAVSPIVKAKEEDTAISVGIIASMGTVFTLIYTIIKPFLHISNIQYGIWSGLSLHEIAHVVAASSPAGTDVLALALLAKLGRVLLLIPLSFFLVLWQKRKNKNNESVKVDFPWFLLGFIFTSILGTYIAIPKIALNDLSTVSSFLLTSAMVGLGLNVDFKSLAKKSAKPLISMLIASIVISIVSFFLVTS